MSMNSESGFALRFSKAAEALGRYDKSDENAQDMCELVRLPARAAVLDVPCGTGRHAAALCRLGHFVTGIDLSAEQIDYAKTHNPGPDYLVADMRSPPARQFDLVINTYSSFGYLDSERDDVDALRAWHTRLRRRGSLIMEISDLERVQWRLGSEGSSITHRYSNCSESYAMDWDTRILTVTHCLDGQKTAICRRRVYSKERLEKMLGECGFAEVRVFGSFKAASKNPDDRAVIVAEKAD